MRSIDNSGGSNGVIKMHCNTAVHFFFRQRAYVPGQVGTADTWMKFSSLVGETEIDVFWVDWRGSYGTQQVQAMSLGVYDLCTLRMDYHPQLYDLLRTKEALVIKNASADAVDQGIPVRNHPDVYTLWGAVDDIRSMRRIMEFKVRRFESK